MATSIIVCDISVAAVATCCACRDCSFADLLRSSAVAKSAPDEERRFCISAFISPIMEVILRDMVVKSFSIIPISSLRFISMSAALKSPSAIARDFCDTNATGEITDEDRNFAMSTRKATNTTPPATKLHPTIFPSFFKAPTILGTLAFAFSTVRFVSSKIVLYLSAWIPPAISFAFSMLPANSNGINSLSRVFLKAFHVSKAFAIDEDSAERLAALKDFAILSKSSSILPDMSSMSSLSSSNFSLSFSIIMLRSLERTRVRLYRSRAMSSATIMLFSICA